MNRMILSLFSSLLIVLLIESCKNTPQQSEAKLDKVLFLKAIYEDYERARNVFPHNLLDHFPKSLDTCLIGITDILSPKMGIIRLDLTKRYYSVEEVNKFIDSSVAIYNADDTCLLVGNRLANREKYLPKEIVKSSNERLYPLCSEQRLPIPNFWQNNYTNDSTACRLDKNFKIYVIEAEPGIFSEEKYLSLNVDFPQKWEHGFSRGVAINKNDRIIIYWVLLW